MELRIKALTDRWITPITICAAFPSPVQDELQLTPIHLILSSHLHCAISPHPKRSPRSIHPFPVSAGERQRMPPASPARACLAIDPSLTCTARISHKTSHKTSHRRSFCPQKGRGCPSQGSSCPSKATLQHIPAVPLAMPSTKSDFRCFILRPVCPSPEQFGCILAPGAASAASQSPCLLTGAFTNIVK